MSKGVWIFDQYRLDAGNASLCRDGQPIHLAPKVFGLLCCLVERSGRLVGKDELLDSVWSHRYVGESTLKGRINELRQVLGDDSKAPRFIETVERRGYRFIAEVRPEAGPFRAGPGLVRALAPPEWNPSETLPKVGRAAPLERLCQLWEIARSGRRQLAFVIGEAGIGKTTLIEMFLDRVANHGIGLLWGRCVEHFGAGEACLPLLEALEKCCRRPEAEGLIGLLRRHAPTWLAQMPSVVDPSNREELQREILGASQTRMLREFSEFAEQTSREMPMLLVLEDLHWSDVATLDLVSLLLRRDERASLLIVASYRPEDAFRTRHPVELVRQEAHVHDRCVEIPLGNLSPGDVGDYLECRFEGRPIGTDVAEALHRRSGGHPLFLVKLLDYLVGKSGFQIGTEDLPDHASVLTSEVPQDLRQLIDWQFERLRPAEQELLEAASVAGAEWSAALVAALLEQPAYAIEAIAQDLVRGRQWLRPAGTDEWPDGTLAGRFAFGHALYEETLYRRVTPARKILWHRRSGERLEKAWGTRVEEVAAAIGSHFERARDYPRAIGHLQLAARHAARRFANREALNYLDHALELLGPRPSETRLDILQQNGAVRRGMGDMEGAVRVLGTMRECARNLGHGNGEVRAVIDLSRVYFWIDRHRTLELAVESVALCERLDDPVIQLLAVATRAGWGFYLEGWQDSYAQICRDALTAARRLGNPIILNTRLSFHTMLETYASNYRLADEAAEEGIRLAESLGDGYLFYLIRYFNIWSLLHLGNWEKAANLNHEALKAAEKSDTVLAKRVFMTLKALLHCEALDFKGALVLCEQAAPLLDQRPDVISTSLFGIVSGKAYLGLGDFTKALGCLEAVLERAKDRVMDWFFYFPLHCTLGECRLARGDRMGARKHAERLREIAARPPERSYLALAYGLLARIALAEENFEEAGIEIAKALAIVEQAEVPLAAWRIHAVAAEVKAGLGRTAEAEQHRERSARILQGLRDGLKHEADFERKPFATPKVDRDIHSV